MLKYWYASYNTHCTQHEEAYTQEYVAVNALSTACQETCQNNLFKLEKTKILYINCKDVGMA